MFVLLPGLDGTGTLFDALAPLLEEAGRVRIVRYGGERTLPDYVRTVGQALPDSNGVLIAESFSGPIAMDVMAQHPQQIRCGILCVTFVRSPWRALLHLAAYMPAAVLVAPGLQRMALRRFCLERGCSAALLESALRALRGVPADVLRARLRLLAKLDMRGQTASIRVPLHLLMASEDRIVGRRQQRELVEAFPRASVHSLHGPHLLLQSKPRECARVIREIVDEVT